MADEYKGPTTYRVLPRYLGNEEYNEYYDRKEQEARDFAERFSEYEDPNYKPKSIMDKFAIDPNYMDKEQPSLPVFKMDERILSNLDSSTKKIFPSIPGSDSPISDEAALLSAFAKTQADKVRNERVNNKTKAGGEEAKAKVKAEKEKFVPRDTVLGRIFDKRVREGEELSNNEKAFALIRNASRNLLERREIGGKEGTDTLSRILGPGGGVEEGLDEIKTLETASESKKAAAVDKALDRKKIAYEIEKINSESLKNIAELAKTDYEGATKLAMEQAAIRGFEPGSQEYFDEVDAIMTATSITEGQANVYTKLMELRQKLQIIPEGDPERAVIERAIAEMEQRSRGTTLNSDYESEQVTDQYGNPKT